MVIIFYLLYILDEINIAGLPDDAILDGTPINEEERKQLINLNLVIKHINFYHLLGTYSLQKRF